MRIKIKSPIGESPSAEQADREQVAHKPVSGDLCGPQRDFAVAPAEYTSNLPDGIREQYEQAYRDPQLLSIRDNISLLQARRQQLIGRIKLGDSVGWRQSLNVAWSTLVAARKRDDGDAMRDAFNEIARLMETADEEGVWSDIQKIDRDLVKWKAMEHDRLMQVKLVLTAEQVAEKIVRYHKAVEDVVSDLEMRAEIGRRLREVIRLPSLP